jgi:hypothetical protein
VKYLKAIPYGTVLLVGMAVLSAAYGNLIAAWSFYVLAHYPFIFEEV